MAVHTHLASVGIDIGSSTSQLMLSQVLVGYPAFQRRRPEVLDRMVIACWLVLLTPFSDDWNIETAPYSIIPNSPASAAFVFDLWDVRRGDLLLH